MLDSGFRDWGCSHGELHARDMTWALGFIGTKAVQGSGLRVYGLGSEMGISQN